MNEKIGYPNPLMKATVRGIDTIFAGLTDEQAHVGHINFKKDMAVEALDAANFDTKYGISEVCRQLDIPLKTFIAPANVGTSTFHDGRLDLTIVDTIGLPLLRMNKDDARNRQAMSESANALCFIGAVELLSSMVEVRPLYRDVDEARVRANELLLSMVKGASSDEGLDAPKVGLFQKFLEQNENKITFVARGAQVQMLLGGKAFFPMHSALDFGVRKIISTALHPIFQDIMSRKNLSWYTKNTKNDFTMPDDDPMLPYLNRFFVMNGYRSMDFEEFIDCYFNSEMGEKVYNAMVSDKRGSYSTIAEKFGEDYFLEDDEEEVYQLRRDTTHKMRKKTDISRRTIEE